MQNRKQPFHGLKASLTLRSLASGNLPIASTRWSAGEASTQGTTPVSSDYERDLAQIEHERREAIFDARDAEGDRPSAIVLEPIPGPPRLPGEARDKLPTLDDLTGPEAPKARWRLVLALVAALGGLGELARQLVTLLGKH